MAKLPVLTLLALVASTGVAAAEKAQRDAVPVQVAPGLPRAAQPLPSWEPVDRTVTKLTPTAAAAPPSRLIYLNNCKAGDGCHISVGREDSRTNHSTVARRTSVVPPFAFSDGVWKKTVECVKKTYARFDIKVTDVDPCPDPTSGCTTPHWETIVAGSPADISYNSNAAGVSPFDFQSCDIIDNSITYAFADVIGPDVDQLCWTIAQETAHSFGFDHEFLGADPMTYLSSPPHKEFQDVNAQCGEFQQRTCYCGFSTRNSVRELLALFGAAPPSPPVITINYPLPGSAVEPGAPVGVMIEDDQGIDHVELLVDGRSIITLTSEPYAFNLPGDLAAGGHHIEVKATDWNGTPGSGLVDVLVGEPCDRPGDCSTLGDNYTCVGGRCVAGPGSPGGLGEDCDAPTDCDSGICATKGGENHCAESCAVGSSDCPSGFACIDAAGAGLCWPSNESCAGCTTDPGAGPIAPIGIGLVLGGLFLRRRRR